MQIDEVLLYASSVYCCSEWGCNRVIQHAFKDQPLQLLSLVLTAPHIMHQAVAGMLYGQLTLSAANVESVLVLANAIRVSITSVHLLHYASSLGGVVVY